MESFLVFILLGLGSGSIYALLAQGVVLIYRGSGVVNFAQGAIAGLGGYVVYELFQKNAWPIWLAILAAVVVCGAIGGIMQIAVMRRLQNASPLARIVATTALLTVLVQSGQLTYGTTPIFVSQFLPGEKILNGDQTLDLARLWIFLLAVVLTVILWVVYRFTRFGLATTAVAENELTSGALGISPGRVAVINWVAGCMLAGLAGSLISPIVSLSPSVASMLIVPTLAAALIGDFKSFPLTLLGGLLVGVTESLLTRYVQAPGWAQSAGFLVIIFVLIVRGKALPLRGHALERRPIVGWPSLRIQGAVIALFIAVALILISSDLADSVVTTCIYGLIALSLIVITGYTGQLSFAQFALAGMGAFVAGRLSAAFGVPFWLCALAAVISATLIGIVIGIPALRTRGINLAIATLGLGLAIQTIILGNGTFTGGSYGTIVKSPEIAGLDLNPVLFPERYAVLSVLVFIASALLVANLRRGAAGRRLLAVRGNERAASALGINVRASKLFAFAFGSAVAAIGGVLIAFRAPTLMFDQFDVLSSITVVVQTVMSGIGFIAGAILTGASMPSGIMPTLTGFIVNINKYIILVSGLIVLITLSKIPDGIAAINERQFAWLAKRIRWGSSAQVAILADQPVRPDRVSPSQLEARNISVAFGGIKALTDVSLSVGPGKIVGLIGPNGAGKTTFIDALTGFQKHVGTVSLNGVDITSWPAHRRAKAGLGRTFQSLELFDDLTIYENLLAASEPRSFSSWFISLIRPGKRVIDGESAMIVKHLGIESLLDKKPHELSAGTRRLAGLARAVSASPSVLLLDEPAAGLDEHETAELSGIISLLAAEYGLSIVLVEHDMNLVRRVCHEVVVLNEGKRLASGPTDIVLEQQVVIEAFVGSSTEKEPNGSGRRQS